MSRLAPCILLLFLATAVLSGCDSGGSSDETSPEVIAPTSFAVDVESFPTEGSGTAAQAGPKAGTHVAVAAVTVGTISLAVEANLLIPKAVTAAALNEDPVIENGTWIWESTTATDSSSASFRLEGTPNGDRVEWAMFVSVDDPVNGTLLTDFQLYTGETAFDGSSGTWSLNYPMDGTPQNVLNADFSVASDSEKSITFTVGPGAEENVGDAILYRASDDQRSVVYTETGSGNQIDVQWDAVIKAGSIQAPDYNNGATSCWSAAPDLDNIACPIS